MAPLADFLLAHVPFPSLPNYLTSYVQGQTPLSTTPAVVGALASYLAIVFGVQAVMKNQQPLKLTTLFQIHNVILSSGSLLLLVLMLEEIAPLFFGKSPYTAMCADEAWTPVRSSTSTLVLSAQQIQHIQRMEFYYMINYSFKYLELLDTVFLALKKKPLGKSETARYTHISIKPSSVVAFLHVFHHSATALLCYSQLNGKTSVVSALASASSILSPLTSYLFSHGLSSRSTCRSTF